MTGLTYARQRREVPPHNLMLLGEEGPIGAFDLEFWAEDNDQTCYPRSGGLANPTSMAAVGGISRRTLVNGVLTRIGNSLHREGPVVISTTNTIAGACRNYVAEQREKQSQAGRRNVANLITWVKPTDQSSGCVA